MIVSFSIMMANSQKMIFGYEDSQFSMFSNKNYIFCSYHSCIKPGCLKGVYYFQNHRSMCCSKHKCQWDRQCVYIQELPSKYCFK